MNQIQPSSKALEPARQALSRILNCHGRVIGALNMRDLIQASAI